MKAILMLLAAICPLPLLAADLACMPEEICIDATCQNGHDDRELLILRNWDTNAPVLHGRDGDVPMALRSKSRGVEWAGRDDAGNMETLSLRRSDMRFTLVIRLEPVSEAHSLTARGDCAVTK